MRSASGSPPPRRGLPLVALLGADGISGVGNQLTAMAVPWLVLQTTGSAAQAGLAVAAGTAATLVGGLFGGAIVDRLGHQRTSIAADLASAATVALIPLLQQTVGLAFWQLLVLVFLGALLDTPGWTARQSLYPDLARLAGYGLDRTNAMVQIVYRLAGLFGPPVAGVLIAVLGPGNVLWLDAATFVVSAGLVALAVPTRGGTATQTPAEVAARPTGYLEEIREGWRFIRHDRLVFGLALVFSLGNLLAEPVYGIILPVYTNQVFGSAVALGLMYAALAAGSLLGNVLFIAFAPRLPRRATIVAGFAVRALTFWVLVPMPPLAVIAGSIVVNATFLEPTNPIGRTILQERVPAGMRGRVFGTLTALYSAARSLGLAGFGLLLEGIGLRTTLIVLAAVNLAVPLVLWLTPALRELDAPRNDGTDGSVRLTGEA